MAYISAIKKAARMTTLLLSHPACLNHLTPAGHPERPDRLRAVAQVIPDRRLRSFGTTLAQLTLWPLASVLYLYNALAAAVSRRITWRGITYELKSPNETVILSREPD